MVSKEWINLLIITKKTVHKVAILYEVVIQLLLHQATFFFLLHLNVPILVIFKSRYLVKVIVQLNLKDSGRRSVTPSFSLNMCYLSR